MLPFATEFPVRHDFGRAQLVAQTVAWLRGIEASNVLDRNDQRDLDGDYSRIRSADGEELTFRALPDNDGIFATGFRHDLPDQEGRLWRTEAVLRRESDDPTAPGILRLRTQCLAATPGAKLQVPKKPYILRTLIKEGRATDDGALSVRDSPHLLGDDEEGLALASLIVEGNATSCLPILYLSRSDAGRLLLDETSVERLAYDLGGVTHVVIEPSREFSFRLRDRCGARNVYGGTIGLFQPNRGIVRRYYFGWKIETLNDLVQTLRSEAIRLRSLMPARGWDWAELQERVLQSARRRDRNRLSAEEIEKLYQEEIANLKEENENLRTRLAEQARDAPTSEQGMSGAELGEMFGPEIYPGEVMDRVRRAVSLCLSDAERHGMDDRTKVVLRRVLERLPASVALAELRQDLVRACKDPSRAADELTRLLCRHGYRLKSDNRHIRLEGQDSLDGLGTITLAKTPSDHRALKNARAQIERSMGLTGLD